MTRNFKDLHFQAEKLLPGGFFNEEVRLDRVDFQVKTKVSEEIRIGNHRPGERMAPDLASKTPFDLRNILHVIDMSVSEEQKL